MNGPGQAQDQWQGRLLVDKPAGWTSFDVVNYVRKLIAQAAGCRPRQVKVGHAGTLDPFATGLLILLIGPAYTRRAGEFSKLDKVYEATLRLGTTSSTGDPEGELTAGSARRPAPAEIERALARFTGQIEQTPPAYSAVKVGGQRAYRLARAGKTVALEPRRVTVHRLELAGYAYPDVRVVTEVSSGTYIRSLAEDIGRVLGTGAYTTALRRTRVGDFRLEDACRPEQLSAPSLAERLEI